MNTSRITNVTITPVAFRDPPLLNAVGIHQAFAVRSIIEVETSDGVTGLSESYGDAGHLHRLLQVGRGLVGHDVFATNTMLDVTASTLGGMVGYDAHGLTGAFTAAGTVLRTFAAFEVAALDIQGKMASRPVSDLLGGSGPIVGALLRVPLLQVGVTPRRRPRPIRRGARSARHRRAGPRRCSRSTAFAPSS